MRKIKNPKIKKMDITLVESKNLILKRLKLKFLTTVFIWMFSPAQISDLKKM